MSAMTATPPNRTLGERLLAPIAEVHADEVKTVVLMTMSMLLLLAAYYMLKTAREALILTHGGAEVKSYSSALQAILLLALIPAYGALASRIPRARLVAFVTLFFVMNIVIFTLFGRLIPAFGIVYFLWVGLFSVMVIAQFWGFANDMYSPEQGRRLFPVIGLGSNIGAWLGSSWASPMILAIGPFLLMLVAGVAICVSLVFTVFVARRQRPRTPDASKTDDAPLGKEGAFALIRRDRYLLYIALLVVFVNIVNSSSDYLVGRVLVERSLEMYGSDPANTEARERFVGATYGRLYSYINFAGLLTQLFLVSRIFKYFGVANALFLHPLIALVGNVLLMFRPSVGLVAVFKVADASCDYSVDNTARQALWLPTSREAKYKAKQAIDSFFVRLGDVLQAGMVYVMTTLAVRVHTFAALNVVLVAGWLAVVFGLRRFYADRTAVRS